MTSAFLLDKNYAVIPTRVTRSPSTRRSADVIARSATARAHARVARLLPFTSWGHGGMIWKGHLRFGLVNIPVALHPAVIRDEPDFTLLDKEDMSPTRCWRR